jgi:hypothetical protein
MYPKYLYALLEGDICIEICKNKIYSQPGVLLIEFAIQVCNWLKFKQVKDYDFNYLSIDYEGPVFSFVYHPENDDYTFVDWPTHDQSVRVSSLEIISCFEKYLFNINTFINSHLGYKLLIKVLAVIDN